MAKWLYLLHFIYSLCSEEIVFPLPWGWHAELGDSDANVKSSLIIN
jgi:hypothetical protein